jgi:hypothetical protein
MCYYIAPELHEQKVFFATVKVDPWPWPVTWIVKYCGNWGKKWRAPSSGLTWFNVTHLSVQKTRSKNTRARDCSDRGLTVE